MDSTRSNAALRLFRRGCLIAPPIGASGARLSASEIRDQRQGPTPDFVSLNPGYELRRLRRAELPAYGGDKTRKGLRFGGARYLIYEERLGATFGIKAAPQAVPPTAKGRTRSRLPVTANTALATAGPIGATPGSPTPVGASDDDTICTSTFGISSMRST